jgi:esterase
LVGHGPRHVIALSGWMGSAAHWGSVFDAMDPAATTVALFDYRGYGARKDHAGPYGFAEQARDVLDLADELGWSRFSLIGHSMGGVAIQHVLALAPERIESLIGITAVPACGSRMDAARLGFFDQAVDDVAVRRKIFDVSTGGRLSGAWLDRMAAASVEVIRPEAMRAYLREWATEDISAQITGSLIPVGLFIGEHDPTLSEALMRDTWMRFYPDATLSMIPNSGHYPMFEAPVLLGTRIDAFLSDRIPL